MTQCEKCGESQGLMTLIEVSEYLKISERTTYGWVKEGLLPAFKVGNAWRFDRNDIDEWIEKQKQASDSSRRNHG